MAVRKTHMTTVAATAMFASPSHFTHAQAASRASGFVGGRGVAVAVIVVVDAAGIIDDDGLSEGSGGGGGRWRNGRAFAMPG